MQNDGAPTQNDAPESHAPKPDSAHSFVCCSALFCLRGRDTLRHETPAL